MKLVLVCLLLVACDNGSGGMMGPMPDAPPGTPACTGKLYDWCANASQCESQDCHFFEKSNFTVCTTTCSADNPCPPDHEGNPVSCNNRGICKPNTANVCALQ
jgi:hypothetical protein